MILGEKVQAPDSGVIVRDSDGVHLLYEKDDSLWVSPADEPKRWAWASLREWRDEGCWRNLPFTVVALVAEGGAADPAAAEALAAWRSFRCNYAAPTGEYAASA